MHKLTINRARIDLRLRPVTPLLVKSGDKGAQLLHPERPDLMCVRTRHGRYGETVYIPGAGLKGVVRSSAERILRSLEARCCDPMDHKSECHEAASKLGDQLARGRSPDADPHPMAPVYKMVCLACRTFGSQALASRTSFEDAYPTTTTLERANATEARSGVSIDRQTGGPSRGKLFEMEVVVGGEFETSIQLANFELWQLALVGVVLADVDEGFVRLGSAKSRGLGRMAVEIHRVLVDQVPTSDELGGVATLHPGLAGPYGLLEQSATIVAEGRGVGPLGHRFVWEGADSCRRGLDRITETAWPFLRSSRGVA
ncbi:MAG: hypothetical protein KF901_22465 [Myxococcales bacterium]|nr:hypothetical protein [Myxococcales bacterium]